MIVQLVGLGCAWRRATVAGQRPKLNGATATGGGRSAVAGGGRVGATAGHRFFGITADRYKGRAGERLF